MQSEESLICVYCGEEIRYSAPFFISGPDTAMCAWCPDQKHQHEPAKPLPAVPQPTGKLEFNAEFHNPEKAWLLIFDGDKDRSLRVSREDVTDLLGRLGWLKMKFEAAESGSQPAQAGDSLEQPDDRPNPPTTATGRPEPAGDGSAPASRTQEGK